MRFAISKVASVYVIHDSMVPVVIAAEMDIFRIQSVTVSGVLFFLKSREISSN